MSATPSTRVPVQPIDLSKLIAALPTAITLQQPERPCYIVIGKPGVGRTTVAKKLAESVNARLVSPERVLADAVVDDAHPEHAAVVEILASGREVPTAKIMELMLATVRDTETLFRGYVLDGVPTGLAAKLNNTDALSEDLDGTTAIRRILTEKQAHHVPILVELTLPEEDLVRRRAAQWTDPKDGKLYPGAQVVFSRKRRAEGHGEETGDGSSAGEGDEDADKDGEDRAGGDDEEEDGNSVDDDEEDEEGEDGEEPRKIPRRKEVPSVPLTNKVEWSLIPMDILDRLVKRPEDSPETVAQTLETYPAEALEAIRAEFFVGSAAHRAISLDASQHPDVIVPALVNRLDALGVGMRVVVPKALPAPEGGFLPAATEKDAVRHYSEINLDTEEPPRELGVWGSYCPIASQASSDGHPVRVSNYNFCVCYKGHFYFQSSAAHHATFLANPLPFLLVPPAVRNLSVCVLGGPSSGKSTLAKLLEAQYELVRISLDEVLSNWESGPYRDEFPEVVEMCKRGQAVPTETQVALVKAVFRHATDTGKGGKGWVLDGFPVTIEQTQALRGAGMIPGCIVHLQNDIGDAQVRARAEPSNVLLDVSYTAFHDEIAEVLKTLPNAPAPDATPAEGPGHGGVVVLEATASVTANLSAVQALIDPFWAKAEVLNAKQAAALGPHIPFGKTKDYCPVALHDHNVLVKGDAAYVVKYQSHYYYLSSSEARERFSAEPQTYVGSNVILPPPIRLAFVGAAGSGKSTLISALTASGGPCAGITHLKWIDVVDDYVKKTGDEGVWMSGEDKVVNPDALVTIMREIFNAKADSSIKSGFLLEGFPHTKMEIETLVGHSLQVDAVVDLSVESETAITRIARDMRKAGTLFPRMREEGDGGDDSLEEEDDLDAVVENVEKTLGQVGETTGLLEAKSTIPVIEVDANATVRSVLAVLREKLKRYLDFRSSLFCSGYAIPTKEATRLLDLGVKSYSPFRKYCPVTLYGNRYITKSSAGSLPVVFGDHIYFLKDKPSRKRFLADIWRYANQPAPPPVVRPRICIVGGAKSGKTSAAKGLAAELDAVYLDVPLVLQSILDGQEVATGLYEELKTILDHGESVPDDLAAEAIHVVTTRALCQEKGWIMDGWPFNQSQALQLEQLGVLPHMVINLQISETEMLRRCALERTSDVLHGHLELNVPEVARARNKAYNAFTADLKTLYHQKYHNWTELDAERSKWAAKTTLGKLARANISHRQEYLGAIFTDKPAPIFDIGTDLQHVEQNMGPFGDYCPVCLTDRNELVKGATGTEAMAEYRGKYYRTAGAAELQAFRADPARYVEHGRALPEALPVQRSERDLKAMFPKGLELRGYCPVTFAEGPKGFQSIVPGSHDYIAEYAGKLYAMESLKNLQSFMRTPWRFASLQLPHKLPPRPAPISVGTLPLVGYLEQTVATQVTEAMLAVGRAKPKFPYKNLEASAVEYLALYLKAHNTKSKDWTRSAYLKRLTQFEERCELISYLHQTAAGGAGGAFIAPEQRDLGFDKRMSEFMELRPLKGV
ncbi:adenylate kinase [Thoreauomyces humboldtii]|nr:adenylate kinase [Thoreauomyces humboldtii]